MYYLVKIMHALKNNFAVFFLFFIIKEDVCRTVHTKDSKFNII